MQLVVRKNRLFAGILLVGLVTVLLVLLDVQYCYLRAIFSFIFLTTIPGFLIMLILKPQKLGFWEYCVYTIGLSIAFLMFAGLAVNWMLPWLHITDKPLSLSPLLISLNIILLICWLIAYERNRDISLAIQVPQLDFLNNVLFTAPIIFLILTILGATTLNNGGSNYLTIIMLGGTAAYVFVIVLFRQRLNPTIYPCAIVLINLSLLLMYSLRSWYVSGTDINEEYLVFQLTKHLSIWHVFPVQQVYSTCLSLTILPTILSNVTNINDNYIYKVAFQVMGAITPLVVYLIAKNYTTTIVSFISAIFFVSYPSYFLILPMHIRTEIGLIFFSLSVLVLLSKDNIALSKTLLFLVFTAALVVSHYSSNYIALVMFASTYIVFNLVKSILHVTNRDDEKRVVTFFTRRNMKLHFYMILFFALFTLLWQVQITPSSANIFAFLKNTLSNTGSMFSQDVRSEQGSFGAQLLPFHKPEDKTLILNRYIQSITNNPNYNDSIALPESPLPSKINPTLSSIIYVISSLNNKVLKCMIIVGVAYIFLFSIDNTTADPDYPILSLMGLLVIIAVLLLPFASIEYSIGRTYQQILIFAAGPTIMTCRLIATKLNANMSVVIVTTIVLIYFLFNTGSITQLVGQGSPSENLNNYGSDFDRFYVYGQEVKSITWLSSNYNTHSQIIGDNAGIRKIEAFGGIENVNSVGLIIPQIIEGGSYVYLTETNTIDNIGYAWIQGQIIEYNIPLAYINAKKNLIYSSGNSEIFK